MKKQKRPLLKSNVHARVPGLLDSEFEDLEEEFDAPGEEAEWNDFGGDDDDAGKTSFACEDCDYRWDEYHDDYGDALPTCPMCGSGSVTSL